MILLISIYLLFDHNLISLNILNLVCSKLRGVRRCLLVLSSLRCLGGLVGEINGWFIVVDALVFVFFVMTCLFYGYGHQ